MWWIWMTTTRIKKQAPAILRTGSYTLRFFALGNLEFMAAWRYFLENKKVPSAAYRRVHVLKYDAQDLQLTFDAREKQSSFRGNVMKLIQFKKRYMSYLSGRDTDSSASMRWVSTSSFCSSTWRSISLSALRRSSPTFWGTNSKKTKNAFASTRCQFFLA